jgi:hypothetical protein
MGAGNGVRCCLDFGQSGEQQGENLRPDGGIVRGMMLCAKNHA